MEGLCSWVPSSSVSSYCHPWTFNNYKDTKTKCRHQKNWHVMGLCGRCLLEFIHWRCSQSCRYFRSSFVNYCPSKFSLIHLPPFRPSLCQVQYVHCTDSVWLGVGVLSPAGDIILYRRLTLCIWPDSESTKLLDHPKQNPRRGRGPRQIITCRKVPLQVNFFW
jgi:hypothetical protein